MKLSRLRFLLLAAASFVPALAHAHPGHDGHEFGWDFRTGFSHPLLGWDHLAAMLAVGIWAAQIGGRARWIVPSAFIALMVSGAALARTGIALSGIEQAIGASILVLGLLIAAARRLPAFAGAVLVGLFAVFHGYAHAAESPESNLLGYGAGFVLATALIHLAGLAAGAWAERNDGRILRAAGCVLAASGLLLLATR